MRIMRKKAFCIFAIIVLTLSANAQSDYSSYLNKALEKLDMGDCVSAQKLYNVYKEITGKQVSSIEELIADCTNNIDKTYKIGDSMLVGKDTYVVAFLRNEGKHGFAICDKGWNTLCSYSEYVQRQEIPTLDELKMIFQIRDVLKIYKHYWSRTTCSEDNEHYLILDFGDEKETTYCRHRCGTDNDGVILLIHKF